MTRVFVVRPALRSDLEEMAREYAADPAVEYCEPNHIAEIALTPNDPYFSASGSWGQAFDDLWGVKKIEAPAAWDMTRGAGITVAVIDTGIDYTHPDIAANMWQNPGEIPGNYADDDGNGYVDDVYGWHFPNNRSNPMDGHAHGTHVAGTIAAVGNNATGVVGVAFESRVMAVKGLDDEGSGSYSDLAEAIVYAVDNGADVINASWGGTARSDLLADAIAYAHAHGTVFVAAAGNNNRDVRWFYPAGDANAIAVAASTNLDERASFSNYGVDLDVTAPGGGDDPPPQSLPKYSILSLLSSDAGRILWPRPDWLPGGKVGNRYLRLGGTSMAAPHASGTAALILATQPGLSVEQVRQVLRTTADDLGDPGPDLYFGHGRVNAARAVIAPPPLVARLSGPTGVLIGETSVQVTGSASGPGFVSYALEYGPAPLPDTWSLIVSGITTPVDEGVLATWDLSEVPDGEYVVRLRATGAGEYIDRLAVTIRNTMIDTPAQMSGLRTDTPIEISGTAAGAGFVSYTVEYRRPALDGKNDWHSDGITLAAPPGTPVRRDLLATLDASWLTAGYHFEFRLTVNTATGTSTRERGGIVIDPTLRAGWPQSLTSLLGGGSLGGVTNVNVADIDGDGTKEILVPSGDQVLVFEPDGSLRPGWPQSVGDGDPATIVYGAPTVADVAGDAAAEVIATDGESVFVWAADGTPLLGFPRQVPAFYRCLQTSWCFIAGKWISAADLNGDGKDEILCTGWGLTTVLSGNGSMLDGWDGDATATGDTPVAVGDVFGDGTPEVATYNQWLPFRTTGLHKGAAALHGADGALLAGWPKHARSRMFERIGMADMDGDRVLDVAVLKEAFPHKHSYAAVKARAFTASGRTIPMSAYRFPLPDGAPSDGKYYETNGLFSYADVDRDGRAEAYLYSSQSSVWWEQRLRHFISFGLRQGASRPQPPPHLVNGITEIGSLAIADIDGDGEQELLGGVRARVLACPDCSDQWQEQYRLQMAVVAATPDGAIVSGFPKPIPVYWPEDPSGGGGLSIWIMVEDPRHVVPAVADLDGDGLKEVIWADPSSHLLFVWNAGGTPGPELADWPMFRHDPKHTNVLPPTR